MIYHTPVMTKEIGEYLAEGREGVFVDCTLGGGGHSEYLLENYKGVQIIGIDRDEEAITFASARLGKYGDRVKLIRGNFSNLQMLLNTDSSLVGEPSEQDPQPWCASQKNIIASISPSMCPAMKTAISRGVAGFLLDLGISSHQVDDIKRGFSFNAPNLDMRMDASGGITAREIVNTFSEDDLSKIFYEYGEERLSRQIARAIAHERSKANISSSIKLSDIVGKVKKGRGRINPATLVFQALRIAVNSELEALKSALAAMPGMLSTGGRIVTLSYHSLEDRMIKYSFRDNATAGTLRIITKKVMCASEAEQSINPRSRSAKLRCAEKV